MTQAGIQRIFKGFNAKKRRRGRPRVAKTSARWWSGLYRPPWTKDAARLLEQCPILLRAHCCCSHASYPHMTKILQQQPLYQPQAPAQQYMPRQQVKQNLNPFPNALGPAAATLALQWSRALHPHLDGDSRLFFFIFFYFFYPGQVQQYNAGFMPPAHHVRWPMHGPGQWHLGNPGNLYGNP